MNHHDMQLNVGVEIVKNFKLRFQVLQRPQTLVF